ncbi:oligosaccharide flippase family protein [Sulfitobacter sp. 1A13496]|uniref:oligosaccharide flippase family protein n=1 Tax=Sulfitobacter sp. 1A13496 TaxID=3368596 RepID=UPI00374700F3
MPVLKALRFTVGFGFARATLFFAPIALANLLPLDHYGQFELAQSYAAIGALVLGAGLPATVPLIRLRDEIEGRWDTLLLLIVGLGGSCILLALMAALGLGTLYSLPVLVLLFIGVLMLQGFWSTLLKSEGRSTSAVFVEAGFWTMAVAGAVLIVLMRGRLPEGTITAALLVYAAALMTLTLTQFNRSRAVAFGLSDLRRNLALGLPLMFTSVLTVVISSSGRLVLGQTSGLEAVGLYAVLYRSTTLPLVGHQILIIGLFRQIFSWSDEVLRSRAAVIVLGVSALVMTFWMLEPYLGWLLGPRFAEIYSAHRGVGLTLLVQTILWSAIALNDLINSRLQIAGRVAMVTGPYLLSGLGALSLWTWSRAPVLETGDLLHGFILGHFCLMAGFYAVQCVTSWRLGYRFGRLWLTALVSTACTGVLILLGDRFS